MLLIAAVLILFLIFILVRKGKYNMKLPSLLVHGVLGGSLGAAVIIGVQFVECLGSSNAFCGFATIVILGPISILTGLTIGLIVGYKKRKK